MNCSSKLGVLYLGSSTKELPCTISHFLLDEHLTDSHLSKSQRLKLIQIIARILCKLQIMPPYIDTLSISFGYIVVASSKSKVLGYCKQEINLQSLQTKLEKNTIDGVWKSKSTLHCSCSCPGAHPQ